MFGYNSPGELLAGITDLNRQFYVKSGRRAEFTRQLEENQAIMGFESEVYRKDGSPMWISENARAVRDEGGTLLYYEGTTEDITARKQAEEELRRRAHEFAALYETAHDLAAQQDLPTLLEAIVERAIKLLVTSSGFIYLYDAAQNELELTVVKGVESPRSTILQMGKGIAGRVAQSHQPLIINDYQTWEHRSSKYATTPYRAGS